MNQIKRQLSDDISSNEETKKLRSQLSSTNAPEENWINCIENLSNELFFEIFDYLDGCLLYDAFSNLNIRFQHLLKHPSLRFKITLTSDSKSILKHYSKNFIIPNKHQIISFRFNNKIDRFPVLSWFPIDSSFTHLESLTLNGIQSGEFALHLRGLVHLPRLFSLTISLDKHSIDIGLIYQLIFNLPQLKYYKFSSNVSNTNMSSLKTNPSQFSSIEYLVMDHPCKLNDLITILSYTPRLSHLSCRQSLLRSNFNIPLIQLVTLLPNLTHVSISMRYLRFDEFENFIKPISSQLRVLKLYAGKDSSYLDADRWEKLIQQYIPQLYNFRLTYMEIINAHLAVTPYHQRIIQFNSTFWIKKQWIFESAIATSNGQDATFIYRVHPRRSKSTDYHYYRTNSRCQRRFSSSSVVFNPLNIYNLSIMKNNKTFFDIIHPILFISSINVLHIKCMEIIIDVLIELIRLLPNLNILAIYSSATMEPKCLSMEQETALSCVSKNNKITAVALQQITEHEQVQFFLQLCLHMRHLEIFCSNEVDPEALLRFVLEKNIKYISNLTSLGVRMPKPNEETREKLQKNIAFGGFHPYYMINERDDRICLRRNK